MGRLTPPPTNANPKNPPVLASTPQVEIPRSTLLPTPLPTALRDEVTTYLLNNTQAITQLRDQLDGICAAHGLEARVEERVRSVMESRSKTRSGSGSGSGNGKGNGQRIQNESEGEDGDNVEETILREIMQSVKSNLYTTTNTSSTAAPSSSRGSAQDLDRGGDRPHEPRNKEQAQAQAQKQKRSQGEQLLFPTEATTAALDIVRSALMESRGVVLREEITDGWVV